MFGLDRVIASDDDIGSTTEYDQIRINQGAVEFFPHLPVDFFLDQRHARQRLSIFFVGQVD